MSEPSPERSFAEEVELRRVAAEERRVALEEARARDERRDPFRRYPSMITAIVSVAAVLVSFAQVLIVQLNTAAELKQQREQAATLIASQERLAASELIQAEKAEHRDWSLKFASFVIANESDIFSPDSARRERMKKIILLSYPEEAWDSIFGRLSTVTAPEQRRTWENAATIARETEKRTRRVLKKSSAHRVWIT